MQPAQLANPDCVDTLYTHHHGWLQGWLRKKLGSASDAADLAHDVFLRVLASRRAVELREPRAYLTTIAHGLMVNHIRRREIERAYLQTLAQLPEPQWPSAETMAILVETLTAVGAMLDGLPPRVREAFLLSQFDGLSYAEIADKMATSVNMVQKYMVRAMQHCYLALHG